MSKGASKPLVIFAAGTLAVAGIGGYAWYESRRPPVLEVYVFDTPGQPSVFIRTPNDKRILIGGGSNSDVIRRLTSVLPFYSRGIDMIIAPDADAKNMTGLIDVLGRYQVGKAYTVATSSDPAYSAFENALKDRGTPTDHVSAGTLLSLDSDVNAEILFPASAAEFKYSKASGPSLVFKLVYGSTSILFTGSATPKIQRYVASSSDARADALVILHSLSESNFAKGFIDKVRPGYLVYSQSVKKPPASQAVMPGILAGKRFNIQEKGIVKIISDGRYLDMKKEL